MYKCKDCGEVFDEPHHVVERHGFDDGYAEHFYVCPNCGGTYEEVED